MLSESNLFVYARGGEYFDEKLDFHGAKIYKAKRLEGTTIDATELDRWIKKNNLDIVISNEQEEVAAICYVKLKNPAVIFGAYIDYYTETTIENYVAYDFLLCNTKRHFEVFEWHPQCFYLPWCVDTELYKPVQKDDSTLTFFHSMGMSNRKGTDVLIKTFIANNLGKSSKLIIHAQKDISGILSSKDAESNNIVVVIKTVPAPGLYHMGDVYVYPTTLDGLGLTMYEAMSCGLPVIATNDAPMNELVDSTRGRLVSVKKHISRSDGYYWPLSFVDDKSLLSAMEEYISSPDKVSMQKKAAREFALKYLTITKCQKKLLEIISSVKPIDNQDWCNRYLEMKKKAKKSHKLHEVIDLLCPVTVESKIREKIENKRR